MMTTVWTVEDNALFRATLAELIDRHPRLTCTCALSTCEELIDRLTHAPPPDVVLLDIGLPGARGVDGIAPIRARASQTRIIMLTVHDDDESVFDALRAGADGYLLKNARGAEITDAIESAMLGGAPINAFIARKILLTTFGSTTPTSPVESHPKDDSVLSAREQQILQELVRGRSLKEIAFLLRISRHTVDTHVRSIYAKLEVNSRGGAVAKAIRQGLDRI